MVFLMRKYKSGTQWCLWRWTVTDSEYITRLHLIKTPWWAICLHWINKHDPEPFHHDHPVSFLSLILRGGYTDEVEHEHLHDHCLLQGSAVDRYFSLNNWVHWIPATKYWRHTIRAVQPGTLTLCFMGRKTREWGFHTSTGWVYWKDYYERR